MPALQVRDFPEDLYEQLRVFAAANHRSMAQQTIIAVEQMINGAAQDAAASDSAGAPIIDFDTEAKRQARIQRYRELSKRIDESNERIRQRRGGVPIPEGLATQWIREDRESDHGHKVRLDSFAPYYDEKDEGECS